ncbi:PEP-CTERM sorting domain-containing protein [Nostoc sp. CMAA1605]|uniref:PEP-CTERM sorting domain-containing protein n=1 Tax=Nostoc sp. CMAA1605 TaxID=2055159 RepID=UPI001F18353B|nr:PEP-CTERM sorting domain-containing protein [Nostoc sp. CMAA1605]MCF4967940.1 hypothetical protein [Nostoc sp. CMAA1605]
MKHLQSALFGATFAATTAAVVAFAPSSAMAISIAPGSVSVGGRWSSVEDSTTKDLTVNFNTVSVTDIQPGFDKFDPELDTGTLTISALNLDFLATQTVPIVGTFNSYQLPAGGVIPFLNFGLRTFDGTGPQQLTFNLTSATFVRTGSGLQSLMTVNNAEGYWTFGTNTSGLARISGEFNSGTGGYSLTATAVPEPLTMGGLALGAGFGAFLKKRYAKKDKELAKV